MDDDVNDGDDFGSDWAVIKQSLLDFIMMLDCEESLI